MRQSESRKMKHIKLYETFLEIQQDFNLGSSHFISYGLVQLYILGRFHPFYRPRRPLGRVEV
jgi:hypothetical protein